ncbi:hypothetical protein SAMN04489798_0184 [Pseudomonas arsenicoxydans]|uniref:Uncharacterized protein n=1 Tax=Pseudomonas arsenicoxydans TaxID=702115 RepID=A0A1H0B121_9PSED|nr:hypothetical protein [Pseudomonas arsenicoxydans]SDN39276.1 hypothetical protein SAMN04489798_0184 [Pseudomonas arsenicoxydans]
MNQRSPGLTWLDRNDHKQQKWAHKYLQKKGEIDQKYDSSSLDELLRIGEVLESTREGILILGRMRETWRQAKCNASDKDKGRKTYAFKLNIEVKKDLTWLAKKKNVTAAALLSRLISGELDAHVRFETELNEEKKTHKELLRNSRNNTAQHRETNRILRELLDVSIARLCRSEILLEDAALSTESITEDQQRRIDKRCKQIMVDAEAVVKGQSALLPGELFHHVRSGSDSTQALKEAATESPSCSNNSPVGNQSSSTEDTFRIDSERLPLPEDHSEPSLVPVAEPHGPGTNNHTGLRTKELPEEKNSVSLEKNATGLESRSAPQRLPDSATTDVASRSSKITLQRKKHSVIRGPQGILEKD